MTLTRQSCYKIKSLHPATVEHATLTIIQRCQSILTSRSHYLIRLQDHFWVLHNFIIAYTPINVFDCDLNFHKSIVGSRHTRIENPLDLFKIIKKKHRNWAKLKKQHLIEWASFHSCRFQLCMSIAYIHLVLNIHICEHHSAVYIMNQLKLYAHTLIRTRWRRITRYHIQHVNTRIIFSYQLLVFSCMTRNRVNNEDWDNDLPNNVTRYIGRWWHSSAGFAV